MQGSGKGLCIAHPGVARPIWVTNRLVMDVMVQKKTLIFLYTVGRTGKYTLTPHSQTQIKAIPHKERTAKRTKKGYNKEVKKQFKEQNE